MIEAVVIQGKKVDTSRAERIAQQFGVSVTNQIPNDKWAKYFLMDKTGISFVAGKQILKGDFSKLLSRVTGGHLQHEILLKAAKPEGAGNADLSKGNSVKLRAVDATAGLGEDSFLLAAMGYEVEMFEHNPITAIVLQDALIRARNTPELKEIAKRIVFTAGESKELLRRLSYEPDLIYLDPMYPEKKKSAESKMKMQVLHQIEEPCSDEEELMAAALAARPKKILIKRPPEAEFLAGMTPSYQVTRKAVRYDCLVL